MENLMYAYIRGYLIYHQLNLVCDEVLTKPLELLTEDDKIELLNIGKMQELKLYYFKEKEILPRVKIVLGFLRNIYPQTLLDIGSGRGVFLFPFMNEFVFTKVTSADILDYRTQLMEYIRLGGISYLTPINANICDLDLEDNTYDVVTMLEVLEHIPEVEKAIFNAVRIAKKFIVVTVPNKEDDNPEHIHLLTKERLTKMFNEAGIDNLKFDGVNGHLFMVARKG